MVFVKSISHPNEFSALTGKTQLAGEIRSIEQAMELLLTTTKGELFGDPDFGCNLYTYLMEYQGEVLYQLIKDDIVKTLTDYDTRIYVTAKDITVTPDNGTLHINISYQIRYTDYNSEYNLLIQKRKEEDGIVG